MSTIGCPVEFRGLVASLLLFVFLFDVDCMHILLRLSNGVNHTCAHWEDQTSVKCSCLVKCLYSEFHLWIDVWRCWMAVAVVVVDAAAVAAASYSEASV